MDKSVWFCTEMANKPKEVKQKNAFCSIKIMLPYFYVQKLSGEKIQGPFFKFIFEVVVTSKGPRFVILNRCLSSPLCHFCESKRKMVMQSEQMKSNKTGSHITGRATNGHWHGSNLFFSCVSTGKNGGKSHQPQSGKKKASCYFARSAANCIKKVGLSGGVYDREGPVALTKKDSSFVKKC